MDQNVWWYFLKRFTGRDHIQSQIHNSTVTGQENIQTGREGGTVTELESKRIKQNLNSHI